ncbi:MAG: NHL repeat-containing protein [Verrucomicrobia bacterium]|nr:NHL repeat-containing protein [Verrucomicrobiota bacterium]
MNDIRKNWTWFILIMALILGVGIYLGQSRRTELGKSFDYSLDEYRQVDPSLIHYTEVEPLVPTLGKISALAVAPDGKIYVGGEDAVQRFPDGGTFLVDGIPTCMAVDDDGTMFVGMQDHVEIRSKNWEKTVWPSPGGKAYLTSIVVDDEYVYVADAGNRRVWRYDKAGGKPLEIGRKDSANGVRGFNIPSPFFDVDLGPDGSLWAVNPGYHALENYRPDGMPISSWEKSSFMIEGFSGCCNPSHFALMPDGSFVTAEKGLPRVKIHNVDGSLRCVVAAPDQFDEGVVGLDVAVDDEGRIYVLDPSRNQVRIFEEKE